LPRIYGSHIDAAKKVKMKPSGQLNQAIADHTDLEFALETQSGFLVVVKGSGNDGRVTLAVRRRVGTPPASAVGLAPDEVKRLINLLCELSPAALSERDKHLVGRARDSYLDDLMGSHNQPENSEINLFMERDFPELANKRSKGSKKKGSNTFLGTETGSLGTSLDTLMNSLSGALAGFKLKPKQIVVCASALVLLGVALSVVAVLNFKPFASHASHANVQADVVAPAPTAGIEEFSKDFVLDMLTFKSESYRPAQVRAMSKMTPELTQKYWQETGFPLTTRQLKSIPQDQEVQVASVTALPISAGLYQVDVVGTVVQARSKSEPKSMPLHIRLTVSKDAAGKLTVTEQKDLSGHGAN
jgi:hypothetical protein